MAIQLSDLTTDLKSITTKLSLIASTNADYLANPINASGLVDLVATINSITTDGLLLYTRRNSNSAIGNDFGSISSAISEVSGYHRDLSIRSQTKNDLYDQEIASLQIEPEKRIQIEGKRLNNLRNTSL